jgi:cysteine desulfurase/selenocysteine lyase
MSAPEPQQPPLPTGFPDVAALARMATELLRTLPGAAPIGPSSAPSNPQPAGLSLPPGALEPSTPAALAPLGAPPGANTLARSPEIAAGPIGRIPALLPHAQAAHGVPDSVLTSFPAYDPRTGSAVLAVPHAAAAPRSAAVDPAGEARSAAAPAYYFLGGGQSELPSSPAVQDPATLFDLAAFAPRTPGITADPAPAAPRAPAPAAGQFYFLDPPAQRAPATSKAPPRHADRHPPFDVLAIRRDFPILQEQVHGRPLAWFDNAATTQKPNAVIERLSHFYRHENSNIHRAAHELAARATDAYENARETVRRFLGAADASEIIFVRGATEAINLVAGSWGRQNIGPGDEIIVSHLEHHANIVPWQRLADERGAKLRVIPVDDTGQILLDGYQRLLNDRTKLVSVTQVSNALGTVVPVKQVIEMAHRAGALALIDGAQSVSHLRVDLQALDADFFVFSGHKIFGPTGIGVVYGKREILEAMPPWQGGGNMIQDVTFERTLYQGPPARFEAGTGNIADAAGLAAALEYLDRVGLENVARYEHDLLEYATGCLACIDGVRLIGTAADKASVISFVLDGTSTDEVGQALNQEGIAVRTGHHCAQPILRRFGLEATVRASLAFYNTCEEVDRMIAVVDRMARTRR